MHRFVVQEGRKKNKNTSLIFFKAFLINAATQSQFLAIYKYSNTLKWGPWGRGQWQTTHVLIPDIYFCLFSLSLGLHGSNFGCDETERIPRGVHYREWANAHPPPRHPGQEGFRGPRGMVWLGLAGGVDGTYRRRKVWWEETWGGQLEGRIW